MLQLSSTTVQQSEPEKKAIKESDGRTISCGSVASLIGLEAVVYGALNCRRGKACWAYRSMGG